MRQGEVARFATTRPRLTTIWTDSTRRMASGESVAMDSVVLLSLDCLASLDVASPSLVVFPLDSDSDTVVEMVVDLLGNLHFSKASARDDLYYKQSCERE